MSFQDEINAVIRREVESRLDRNSEVIDRQAAILLELRGRLESVAAERDALQQNLDAVVAENVALKDGIAKCTVAVEHWNSWADRKDKISLHIEDPSTDAILNAVRAEGIHFAANRMLAAWESGFINDTPEQAFDISGAVLTAVEFLPNASPEEFTREYCDEVRSAIAESRNADVTKGGSDDK